MSLNISNLGGGEPLPKLTIESMRAMHVGDVQTHSFADRQCAVGKVLFQRFCSAFHAHSHRLEVCGEGLWTAKHDRKTFTIVITRER